MPALRASLFALAIAAALAPVSAPAQAPPAGDQNAPPPAASGAAPPKGAITREEFVQRASDAAGKRFDQIDTNHLGYITRAQLRAFRTQRRAGGTPPPSQQ